MQKEYVIGEIILLIKQQLTRP